MNATKAGRRPFEGGRAALAGLAAPFVSAQSFLEGQPVSAIAIAALAAIVILLAIAFVIARLQLARQMRRAATLTAQLDLHRNLLLCAPFGVTAWRNDDPGILFEHDGHSGLGWETVRRATSEADAALLGDAIEALRTTGRPFQLAVPLKSRRRVFVVGDRVGDIDGVWIRNATEEAGVAGRLLAERDAATLVYERFRRLLDMLPLPVWERAPDLSLVYVNRAYADAVDAPGVTRAMLEGREIAAGVIGQDGRALADRARRAGNAVAESHHVVLGDARRLLEFTEMPLDDNGAIGGFARDGTDLERVQSDLSRHIDAHAEVLELLGAGVALFGPDRRLKFFNQAYATLKRLDPVWLRSEPYFGELLEALRERRLLPEVANFRAFKDQQLALFNAVIDPVEELLQLPDETTVRRVTAAHPLGGLIVVEEDVTDRLALERSYNTLIAVQRETLDQLQEGLSVYGTDGRLKLYNPAFQRIWGLTDADLEEEPHIAEIAERTRELQPDSEDWETVKSALVRRVTDRRGAEGRMFRRDGRVLDYVVVPLSDGSVLDRYLDVTDTYNVERALIERNEALEEAGRLKTEFLANVSYELRTPLNTIIGFAEILANGYFGSLNDRQVDYCTGILDSSRRLLDLINDILDLAMIEAGQLALALGEVDVEEMLVSVLNLLRERARQQGLSLEVEAPPDLGTIRADERRLKQVLFNIIGNAVNFTPAGGSVRVAVRREAREMLFEVVDTGPGIPAEDQSRVFGMFEQSRTAEHRQSGPGLGLALVKHFIEMHGGQVELTSSPGTGTRVAFRLPLHGPEA